MAIRNPVGGAARARACLVQAGTVLTVSLLFGSELNTTEHRRQVQGAAEASREACKHEEKLFFHFQQLANHRFSRKDLKRLARIPKSGDWLTILPGRWHGTLLLGGTSKKSDLLDLFRLPRNLELNRISAIAPPKKRTKNDIRGRDLVEVNRDLVKGSNSRRITSARSSVPVYPNSNR